MYIHVALVRTALVNIPLDLNHELDFNEEIGGFANSPDEMSIADFHGFWMRYTCVDTYIQII